MPSFSPTGPGWQRFQRRLEAMEIGAREMARTQFLVGSSLPYASHWIEEGWRNDPRYGTVYVSYRQPDTWFMRDAVQRFVASGRIGARRPGESVVGGVLGAADMEMWATSIADEMRDILLEKVYSAPVPTRGGVPRWVRSHQLYNSIKAYRA